MDLHTHTHTHIHNRNPTHTKPRSRLSRLSHSLHAPVDAVPDSALFALVPKEPSLRLAPSSLSSALDPDLQGPRCGAIWNWLSFRLSAVSQWPCFPCNTLAKYMCSPQGTCDISHSHMTGTNCDQRNSYHTSVIHIQTPVSLFSHLLLISMHVNPVPLLSVPSFSFSSVPHSFLSNRHLSIFTALIRRHPVHAVCRDRAAASYLSRFPHQPTVSPFVKVRKHRLEAAFSPSDKPYTINLDTFTAWAWKCSAAPIHPPRSLLHLCRQEDP